MEPLEDNPELEDLEDSTPLNSPNKEELDKPPKEDKDLVLMKLTEKKIRKVCFVKHNIFK